MKKLILCLFVTCLSACTSLTDGVQPAKINALHYGMPMSVVDQHLKYPQVPMFAFHSSDATFVMYDYCLNDCNNSIMVTYKNDKLYSVMRPIKAQGIWEKYFGPYPNSWPNPKQFSQVAADLEAQRLDLQSTDFSSPAKVVVRSEKELAKNSPQSAVGEIAEAGTYGALLGVGIAAAPATAGAMGSVLLVGAGAKGVGEAVKPSIMNSVSNRANNIIANGFSKGKPWFDENLEVWKDVGVPKDKQPLYSRTLPDGSISVLYSDPVGVSLMKLLAVFDGNKLSWLAFGAPVGQNKTWSTVEVYGHENSSDVIGPSNGLDKEQ